MKESVVPSGASRNFLIVQRMATTAAVPPSFPSLEAEAAFWRERAAVAEAAARDAREELEEFQVRTEEPKLAETGKVAGRAYSVLQ